MSGILFQKHVWMTIEYQISQYVSLIIFTLCNFWPILLFAFKYLNCLSKRTNIYEFVRFSCITFGRNIWICLHFKFKAMT